MEKLQFKSTNSNCFLGEITVFAEVSPPQLRNDLQQVIDAAHFSPIGKTPFNCRRDFDWKEGSAKLSAPALRTTPENPESLRLSVLIETFQIGRRYRASPELRTQRCAVIANPARSL